MRRKRSLPVTTNEDVDHIVDFFDLNEVESTEFWSRSDAVDTARAAIELRTSSRHGIADYIKYLKTIMLYVIKAYSIEMKSTTTTNESFMKKVFNDLQNYKSSKVDDVSINLYLASCVFCSSNFSANLRTVLIRTLVARHLLPTTEILSVARGGQKLLTDWQRKSLEASEYTTNHLSATLYNLLRENTKIGRAICDSTLQEVVELSAESKTYAPMTVWNNIWKHIGSKPTASGKRLALALLDYTAIVNPDLYSIKNVIFHESCGGIPLEKSSNSQVFKSDHSGLKMKMQNCNCPELLPLLIICHTEKDISTISSALQILASSAHSSIIKWSLVTKNQLPFRLWTSVLEAVTVCLKAVNTAAGTHKFPQYKMLCILNQILLSNPFGRNFSDKSTAQQAIDEIVLERNDLTCMLDEASSNAELTKSKSDITRAIEFLSQELMYVSELQSGCYPAVLSVLARGSIRGIASRTLSVIKTILRTTCCGVDPIIIMEYPIGLPDEINAIIGNVLQTRCVHEASFLEVAASAIDSTQGAKNTGCKHILKSFGHRQLLQLSKIYQPSSAPSERLQADLAVMVRSLVAKLSSALQSSNECNTDNRSAQAMLLSLSVMPMHYNGTFSDEIFRNRLTIICEYFILSLEELKYQTLDGSAAAALYCTIWLQFLAQLKKCTNSARSYMGSIFELGCISQKSLSYMIALIYPDLLSDSCVMPAAIAFAMQQRGPLRLLFESIGNLQDSTFDSGKTDLTAIIHYCDLIATVVLENSKVVKNLVQERFSAALNECNNSSESVIEAVDPIQPDNSSRNDSRVQANGEEIPVSDYMNRTNLLANASLDEIEDLETSVDGDTSFLACFLPLFLNLLVDEGIPGVIRVSALRTLSAYMRCSKRILLDHVQILETYITTSNLGHPQELRLEALLIWVENFNATPVNVLAPVRGLIYSLKRANSHNGIKIGRHGRKSESMLTTEISNVEQSFLLTTIQSMYCLVKENKLRDPAEYTLAIGIPYAIENSTSQNSVISALQEECSIKLLDIFVGMPSLLTRTLYQLCLPMQPLVIDEASQELEAAHSVGSLIISVFDESHRLRIVGAIAQLARSDDLLAKKLEEVDVALTDQVLRGHHSFALAALSNFDVTTTSVKAIKKAVDLGSINHLDPNILCQLKERMANLSSQESRKIKIGCNDDDIDSDSFIEGDQQHE